MGTRGETRLAKGVAGASLVPMKVLVIGGTGLIGPHLVQALMSAGVAVSTLTRTGRALFCETALRGNRRKRADIVAAIDAVKPDLLVDMIPFTLEDAQILRDVIKPSGLPLIALSSCDVYRAYGLLRGTEEGLSQACPLREEAGLRTAFGPEGAAYDKIGVEQVYMALDTVTILRMPIVYGWPDLTRVEPYLDQMLDGVEEITLSADRAALRLSRSLHKNAAHAVVCAAAYMGSKRIYNVAEPKAFTEADWIKKIAAACGWTGELKITKWQPDVPSPRQQLYVNSDAIRKDLNFTEMYDPEDGFAEMVRFHAYQRLGKPYQKFH